MGLNIKNPEVEKLVTEVAKMTGESKTEAVRQAMLQRKSTLSAPAREKSIKELMDWLRTEIWPRIPEEVRRKGISKAEREEILGYGPNGYSE